MQTLKEDIRDKILEVALKEFSSHGFAKASMRTIASKTGVGVGNIYNYFPSKDALFCAVLSPVVKVFNDLFERHHGDCSDAEEMLSEEYLNSAVSEYLSLLKGNRGLMRVLFFGAQGSSLENFKSDFTDMATADVEQDARLPQDDNGGRRATLRGRISQDDHGRGRPFGPCLQVRHTCRGRMVH